VIKVSGIESITTSLTSDKLFVIKDSGIEASYITSTHRRSLLLTLNLRLHPLYGVITMRYPTHACDITTT